MKTSIIIPIKNEPYIHELIKRIHKELKGYNYEIIVIDKSDVTPRITNAKLVKQMSRGLGKAVLEGLVYAEGDVVVLMDGDGSHRPEDVSKLLKKINGYDIVIGSRFVPGGKTKDKTHRRIISWVYRKFASFVLGLDVKDSMSGFSVVKREVYDNLNLNPLGYKINTEILFKGKKAGYKICEVPIVFEERKYGRSKAGVKEGFRILRYVLELKLGLR